MVTESKSGDFNVDTETELAWSTRISVPLHYAETQTYCASLGKGWRLPTIGELQTMMSGEGDAMKMKPAWSKDLPDDGVLFSSEEIPRIDDQKQPLVMRIENGKSFAGQGGEGYARCVHGPISRQRKPFPMPPVQLMAERWWEQDGACPPGSVARGTPGRLVSCKSASGQTNGRSTSWTRVERIDASYRNETLHGTMVKWRADGLKESEANYREGELHGRSTQWHANGEKSNESTFVNGKLHGKVLRWRADGLEESEISYRNGEPHGRSTSWYDNGEKYSESTFAGGKPHGKSVKWRADGLKESELIYRNGELHGRSTHWHTNGEKSNESTFVNGKLHGKVVKWRSNGLKESEKNYRSGDLHGSSSSYFPNGEKSNESNFANGLLSGVHQRWDEQGNLLERTRYANARIVEHIHYENGKPRNGSVKTKHPNGVASYVGVFKDGVAQGKHYGFYLNGKQKFERNYNAKGIPSGRSVNWHSTGEAQEVSRFVRGALHGERAFFDKSGVPQGRFFYNQGIPVQK